MASRYRFALPSLSLVDLFLRVVQSAYQQCYKKGFHASVIPAPLRPSSTNTAATPAKPVGRLLNNPVVTATGAILAQDPMVMQAMVQG